MAVSIHPSVANGVKHGSKYFAVGHLTFQCTDNPLNVAVVPSTTPSPACRRTAERGLYVASAGQEQHRDSRGLPGCTPARDRLTYLVRNRRQLPRTFPPTKMTAPRVCSSPQVAVEV